MAKWLTAAWLAIGVPFILAGLSGRPEARTWAFYVVYVLYAVAAVTVLLGLQIIDD